MGRPYLAIPCEWEIGEKTSRPRRMSAAAAWQMVSYRCCSMAGSGELYGAAR
ncbi:MAG TPA: hypothetical protein PLD58_24405 [Phycisphaerae bacterium]|nr:hypothetical protein [Phycisphaerae bacterium]